MRFLVGRLRAEIRSMLTCRRGQVAIIFAFAATMLFVAVGMGIDLWRAYSVRARLQAAVDAAALAIASTDRTQFTDSQLQARAQAYVTANYPTGVLGKPDKPTFSYGSTINIISVTDSATVATTFMRIVGINTLSINVAGQAKAAWPNIDFYLLLNSSPSMGIAATQNDINMMVKNTTAQCNSPPSGGSSCGCGFACHETNPAGDTHCNKTACNLSGLGNTGGVDNYQLSKNLGVTLRIDNLRLAAQNLMTTAQSTENSNNATYRMAIYTYDVAFNNGKNGTSGPIQSLTSNLTTAQASAASIQQLTVYQNNWLTKTNKNNDADTDLAAALTGINTVMPDSGHGTKSPGDTPKEVMFFVTDGENDSIVGSCKNSGGTPKGSAAPYALCSGNRQMSALDPSYCTTIKNRGILIAVLYTEYLPLPTNGWYNTYVSAYQPGIATQLQACATPGLYTEVLTGGDISAALTQLFLTAVNSVFLSK